MIHTMPICFAIRLSSMSLPWAKKASWAYYRPQTFINNFRNQDRTVKPNYNADGSYLGDYSQADRYPNVDWQEEMFKDFALSYNTNLNISGGTKFVKYFVAFDFQNEGDMTKVWENHQGYEGGYTYNRLNVRSNLDFQITKTTMFKVNLAGSNAQQKTPRYYYGNNGEWFQQQNWAGAYGMAPNLFPVRFSDGSWGYYPLVSNIANSPRNVANVVFLTSIRQRTPTCFLRMVSFFMRQPSSVIQALISMKVVTGSQEAGKVEDTFRATEMSLQLYWARQFGVHNVSLMGNWKRRIDARGTELENRREDWVFRTTYDLKSKYFAEFNGAYNGSQKFSPDNRFAFFCSGAAGWMMSEENFMRPLRDKRILDMFKIRGSYGEIGDDSAGSRWAYLSDWSVNRTTIHIRYSLFDKDSPFTGYYENLVLLVQTFIGQQ